MRKLYSKRSRKPNTRKPKTKSRPKTKKAMTSLIKSVIKRTSETKEVWYPFDLITNTLQSTTSSIVGNYQVLTPWSSGLSIVQGTADQQRIGNKVSVKKAELRYTIVPYKYDVTYNANPSPSLVRIYLFRRKNLPATDVTASNFAGSSADFFESTYNSNQGFEGDLGDLQKVVNKEKYTLLRYFTHKVGFQNSLTLGSTNNYEGYVNNDFKLNILKKVDITNQYSKMLMWDDSSTSTASIVSPWLFMLVQPVNAVGLTNSQSIIPITVSGSIHVEYQDD